MPNRYFQFKQFTVYQERCAMKVTTDACLFGAWVAEDVKRQTSNLPTGQAGVKGVLDVGSGTGLLSLMLAQKNPSVVIDAIEVEQEAYEQSKENVGISPFADQIHTIKADIKQFSLPKQYDLIISNPPFYENEIKSDDKTKNLAHHHSGLLLEELFSAIKTKLSPEDGIFYVLLPYKRNEEIKKILLRQSLFVSKIVFVRQSTNHDYFRIMITGRLSSREEKETHIEEIAIWNDHQEYTPEFVDLLKDYYLNL